MFNPFNFFFIFLVQEFLLNVHRQVRMKRIIGVAQCNFLHYWQKQRKKKLRRHHHHHHRVHEGLGVLPVPYVQLHVYNPNLG